MGWLFDDDPSAGTGHRGDSRISIKARRGSLCQRTGGRDDVTPRILLCLTCRVRVGLNCRGFTGQTLGLVVIHPRARSGSGEAPAPASASAPEEGAAPDVAYNAETAAWVVHPPYKGLPHLAKNPGLVVLHRSWRRFGSISSLATHQHMKETYLVYFLGWGGESKQEVASRCCERWNWA